MSVTHATTCGQSTDKALTLPTQSVRVQAACSPLRQATSTNQSPIHPRTASAGATLLSGACPGHALQAITQMLSVTSFSQGLSTSPTREEQNKRAGKSLQLHVTQMGFIGDPQQRNQMGSTKGLLSCQRQHISGHLLGTLAAPSSSPEARGPQAAPSSAGF